MTYTGPLVHTAQQEEIPVYHSDSVVGNDGMDDLREKYDEMQQEMKAIRGNEMFGQEAHELCLVPNVVIPPKFKLPEFEKYKGNTSPRLHLAMYVRKMSAHAGNDKLLIHCFQDSLANAASRWYVKLEKDKIRTFNELGNAFIQQCDYNAFLAPDREQLRVEVQGDKETFKAYALRWRELAAQVVPPLGDQELTRIFLKTLNSFYYDRMVATAPQNFNDMVIIGMHLEKGVREGHLTKESGSSGVSVGGSTSGTKKFRNGYPKKSAQEVGMVAHGGSQPIYPNYPFVANISPSITAPQNQNYQPKCPKDLLHTIHHYTSNHIHNTIPNNFTNSHTTLHHFNNNLILKLLNNLVLQETSFLLYPMLYGELLPSLLARNLVQLRPPPRVQNPLPP